jgi:hypothetical protein
MIKSGRLLIAIGFALPPLLMIAQGRISGAPTVAHGEWLVTSVICPTCGNNSRPEIGSSITFDDTTITNPVGGDCVRLPGYGLLRNIPTSKLLESKGKLWPKELIDELTSSKYVTYGYITCEGMNHMRIIFALNDRAYYFWEGDTILVLQRKQH